MNDYLGIGAMDYETAKRIEAERDSGQGELLLDRFRKEPLYNLTDKEFDEIMEQRYGKR